MEPTTRKTIAALARNISPGAQVCRLVRIAGAATNTETMRQETFDALYHQILANWINGNITDTFHAIERVDYGDLPVNIALAVALAEDSDSFRAAILRRGLEALDVDPVRLELRLDPDPNQEWTTPARTSP